MEPNIEVARYKPGQPIDTHKLLLVAGLASPDEWRPLENCYPEIMSAGPHAPFREVKELTIFPPQRVSKGVLYMIVGGGDRIHPTYPHPNRTRPVSVLTYSEVGYPQIHIYRRW